MNTITITEQLPMSVTKTSPQNKEVLAIEVKGLTKRYGLNTVVNNLNLAIPQGSIFGFLGQNGAGKTTTIRMLLGLIKASSGRASILGHDTVTERNQILPRVGAIVETPTFYPYLSGRENLKQLALIAGVPFSRIDEVLEQVELSKRDNDKVKTYSLGMKQRLGIAAALLNNPQVIFLDEPTNGLDPQGTVDMRNLILRLAQSGRTIFLSSHQLHEIEQICSHVAIISHGKLVVQGSIKELLEGSSKTRLEVAPVSTAMRVLSQFGGQNMHQTGPGGLEIEIDPQMVPEAVQALVGAGVRIYSVGQHKASLENYFLAVTGGEGIGSGGQQIDGTVSAEDQAA
jgi:ABC-type multidrug transport system ATPase subunit